MTDNIHNLALQLIDTIKNLFENHDTSHAMHSQGIDFDGFFQPNDSASSVSKAPHLQNIRIPITVRFSGFGTIPRIPGTEGLKTLEGMSIKFHLPDGSVTDIITHSYNGYPMATSEQINDFLKALGASALNATKPTPLDIYIDTYPSAKKFLQSQIPPPVSYATISYFGVNTFKFVNAKNQITYGRYQIRPEAGEQSLSPSEAAKKDSNYLFNEITERVVKGTIKFKLFLEIAEPSDKLDDPSIAWPNTRTKVELGTIEIHRAVADNKESEHERLYLPGALPAGIESADPMIDVRTEVYRMFRKMRDKN